MSGDGNKHWSGQPTGSCELGVYPLAHDALQSEACRDERDRDERERVVPREVAAATPNAPVARPPDRERSGHREERLEERAEDEPRARLRAHAVAKAANEGADEEGENGREREAVGQPEGVVVPAAGLIFEQTGKGDGKLETGAVQSANSEGVL
jgi:hypothetical protein